MKKTTIGVYDSLDEAREALHLLEKNLIPTKQLAIVESHENLGNIVRYKFSGTFSWIGFIASISIGLVLGILSGENIITIPLFRYFKDGGWILGAIAGANIGLIFGTILTFIITLGLSKIRFENFKSHIMKGRYLLVAHGNRIETQLAEDIIREHGKQFSVDQIES